MKKTITLSLAAMLLMATTACTQTGAKKNYPKEITDSTVFSAADFSYAMGVNVADFIKQQNVEGFSQAEFINGIKSRFSGADTIAPQKNLQILNNFMAKEQKKKQAEQERELQSKYAKEINDGKAFLEANAKEAGVVTLPSGLQYKILSEGTGAYPVATDKVEVNYVGTLLDGTKFDSSYDRNQSATFALRGVIAGWTEGLQKVKEGGKIRLFVPSNLAYGSRQTGDKIKPFSTLIFDVELIRIVK